MTDHTSSTQDGPADTLIKRWTQAVVTDLLRAVVGGWLLMLTIGVLHHWIPAVPPIGYLDAAALAVLLVATVAAIVRPSR